MHISHSHQEPFIFAPAASAVRLQEENEQRPHIEPVVEATPFATRQEGATVSNQADSLALYNRQGQTEGSAQSRAPQQEVAAKTVAGETNDGEPEITTDAQQDVAGQALTLEQQEELLQMQQRDQEVRLHEQQHASVGGQHTGSPQYEYTTGPDGKQYVVEGSVSVDLSPIAGDPNATIEKMRQVKAAALAPAEPSNADKEAAARADAHIAQATAELMQSGQKANESDDKARIETANAGQPASNNKQASAPPARDAIVQQEQRNKVIANVYGQADQAASQQLLNLA